MFLHPFLERCYTIYDTYPPHVLCTRVQWFSTFFRFYHMNTCHEWDLLVLRPLKKKKKFSRTPHRVHARDVFKTRRATGSLKIGAGFWNSANIFTKHQRILEKKKIRNSTFISKDISLEKMVISRVPQNMVKTIFFFSFLLLVSNICPLGLIPLGGKLQKCFVKFKMNL